MGSIRERIADVWSYIGERGWSQYNNLLHALWSDGSLIPADEVQAAIKEAIGGARKIAHEEIAKMETQVQVRIDAAVEAERERCARIAAGPPETPLGNPIREVCQMIAAAIREAKTDV